MPLEIATPRLILRPFAAGDLAALLGYRRDPEVARYQSWWPDFSEAEGRAFLSHVAAHQLGEAEWVNLAVTLGGEVIGDVGLCRRGPDEAELGFTFSRAYQGRGLAREAVAALLAHAEAHLGLRRFLAVVDSRNPPALRLVGALGFTERARDRDVLFKGERWDELHLVREAASAGG
jgi:aminoglycoside 6'-N-acetyltransferase